MGLNFLNLDAETRQYMIEEIELDSKDNNLHLSSYFTESGRADYPALLRAAVIEQNDVWLSQRLNTAGRLMKETVRKNPKGGYSKTRVQRTAAETFSEAEFNLYYMRALAKRAVDLGLDYVEVYRAKAVDQPRAGSEEKIGQHLDAVKLLSDLRAVPLLRKQGNFKTLHGLALPNSGLSVLLPQQAINTLRG